MRRERFAPSPTGPLHLGHAFSAITAHDAARAAGGEFHIRIEDIDQTRARPTWEAQIFDDLAWLGLEWEHPSLKQSQRLPIYKAALETLWEKGLLYPCGCKRRDIEEALSAPQEGVRKYGPDGVIYPGTCHSMPREGSLPSAATLRLDLEKALNYLPDHLSFTETGHGPNHETGMISITTRDLLQMAGDIVVSRKEFGTSYHLSVVIDDAAQNITHVTRGNDLFEATALQIVLQKLLGLPTPIYHHHRLIRDENGKRLAKRDDARALSVYRDAGLTPLDIRKMIEL